MTIDYNEIIYFANVNSPHIKRWIEVSSEILEIDLFTIHKPKTSYKNINIHYITPIWAEKLGIIRYIIGGLLVRKYLKNKSSLLVHAHNTSGYGLMALIAKYQYIITTYGSEIYEVHKRGRIYSLLIKRILQKSNKITASTEKMKEELSDKLGILPSKIYTFTLGINKNIFYKKESSIRKSFNLSIKSKIWIVNRRVLPLYNTIEVVKGFIQYLEDSEAKDKLFILCGDYEEIYLQRVKEVASANDGIVFVEEILTQEELSIYLSSADFTISVPNTDQLSASIVEAMSCGAIPILSDLSAYNILKENNTAYFVSNLSVEGFFAAFTYLGKIDEKVRNKYLNNIREYIKKYENNERVQKDIEKLYTIT